MKRAWPNKMLLSGCILGSVFALVLFSACGSPPSATGRPVLTVLQSSVSIGDPHIASDSSNRLGIIFSIYEALVKRDEEGDYGIRVLLHIPVGLLMGVPIIGYQLMRLFFFYEKNEDKWTSDQAWKDPYSWANTPMPPFSGIMMYGPAEMPGATS